MRAAGSITHGESGVSRRTGPPKNDPFRHGRSANATPQAPLGTASLAPGTLAPSPRQATVPDLQRRFLLQAAEGELAWHIALKLIAFILWMEHEPQVEMVVLRDAAGKVRLWGDCRNIAVRKIERVAG